jgi:hypothetical protein
MKIIDNKFLLVIVVALMFCGCATTDLSGRWNLKAQDGKMIPMTIQDFGGGKFYLHGDTPLDGVYRRRDDELVCTKPDDPRLTGFVWRVQNQNNLVLVSEPPLWVSQERYIGDRLIRP